MGLFGASRHLWDTMGDEKFYFSCEPGHGMFFRLPAILENLDDKNQVTLLF